MTQWVRWMQQVAPGHPTAGNSTTDSVRPPLLILLQAHTNCIVPLASTDADLYLALWHEAAGNVSMAMKAMEHAVSSPYGPASQDYMWYVALVHTLRRGWVADLQSGSQPDAKDEL